ncbi:2-oxoglutarate dehydrogenase E1 component [Candidatus Odyssella thessalonicensis]|uniref:2-oxoglutarate dehydrogenase E1 component n=1 Tax=Candidatus Odyssella thessalonicensis TaxID=84647 RepID=UPI000225A8B8|nr:2-oxoglutarate dehydrogenase E1 component [Candidatus Odyssella thessalonicensis]
MTRTIDPESFLSGANAPYIIDLFQSYVQDPNAVDREWRLFFDQLDPSLKTGLIQDDRAPVWKKSGPAAKTGTSGQTEPGLSAEAIRDSIRALMLIRSYRVRGHLNAKLDPLGLDNRQDHTELMPQSYGFTAADMQKRVYVDNVLGLQNPTLQDIYNKLQAVYCQTIGVEFMHIQHPDQKSWIQERVENTPPAQRVDAEDRIEILKNLIAGDSFERFLQVKYPGVKRFGLEGGESLIPALTAMVDRLADEGVSKIVFGTAHRGRLNVLSNILKKPNEEIFAHFQGGDVDPESFQGTGDVKYHLGYSVKREVRGRELHLSLMPNPSHLEAVDPVVLGKVRAEQDTHGDEQRRRTVAVLMHGDAAFAGQGLVAETLALSGLKGYTTGGTIHIIINNQIGFTTSPPHSRCSPYSSDIAKAIQAPVFHVNADDPEAVVWAMRLAVDFHRQFSVDVVLDLVCYRRHGHNEIDEPSFTQPLMYRKINQHPSTFKVYSQKLIEAGTLSEAQVKELVNRYENDLRQTLDSLDENKTKLLISKPQWLDGAWKHIKSPRIINEEVDIAPATGAKLDHLEKIAEALTRIPDSLKINPRLQRVLKAKQEAIESGQNLDWATGEALAFGSLLLEGKPVRLSGQDVGRGTFSHRHAVWVDQETEQKYIPLNNIGSAQALFSVIDSPLAEASVLGFEYGYSLADPNALVLWEAQFGDFANGAQVIIDQFISAGERKWQRLSGLVMLLPHGYEGQGPEHSSCRFERYLQLCAENNMRVVNCTTPANYFHALRRQLVSETRRPLIVVAPKTLLRHKSAVSKIEEMFEGTSFKPIIADTEVKGDKVNRVVLCSGKIYYELYQERQAQQLEDVALIRLEQYYPLPEKHLIEALKPYAKTAEFIWCQEEPENMGAWFFLDRKLEKILETLGARSPRFKYAGRPEAASPATGNATRHEIEQRAVITQALGLNGSRLKAIS